MAIKVDTRVYQAHYGHKPRQTCFCPVSTWAFEVDGQEPPVFINASYKTALKQAKAMAQHTVEVLP